MKNYDEWHQGNTVYKYFILTPNSDVNFEENLKIECGDAEFTFTLQSLGILDEFVIDYFKEIISIYQNNLEEFLTKHSKIISKDISIFQIQFNSKNNNLLTKSLTNIEMDSIFKNELREKLGKKAEIAALKNSFQFIIEPLIDSINNYFVELYNQGMDRKKFINFAIDTIKVSFDEIEKKIKQYNESLKELKEKKNEENENQGKNEDSAPTEVPIHVSDVSNLYDDAED